MSLLRICTLLLLAFVAKSYGQDGYARGTTGGAGGQVVTATNEAELRKACEGDTKRIIKVDRMISLSKKIHVGSNKSILGTNKNAGLTAAGFHLIGVRNVIIRGLQFGKMIAPNDGVLIQASSNVWVDHNDFYSELTRGKDFYDGLCDINHGSDWITVSWNKFHHHWKVSLVGNSEGNGNQDKGKLHVTYHHNWFYDVGARLPSVRFGTAHIYNNLYERVSESAINVREGGTALVENNVFRNVKQPLCTKLDSQIEGSAMERGNDWGNSKPAITKTGAETPPYSYTLEGTNKVEASVRGGAGQTIAF